MAKGKYAVRAANKRAFASHESAEELRSALDAANRQIELLGDELAQVHRDIDASVKRQVREALREERARIKAVMRDNAEAARNKIVIADLKRADRDAAMVSKLETALHGLVARAVELTGGGQKIFNMPEVLVLGEIFEDLGVKHGTARIRAVFGHESEGNVIGNVNLNARYLNRRSAKTLKRQFEEISREKAGGYRQVNDE